MNAPVPDDSSDTEIEAFDAVCMRLAGFEAQLSTEWVDGFLAALAAGPRAIDIDEWLPLLCGDAFERCFGDPADAEQARATLQRRAQVLARQLDAEALLDAPDALRLQPLIYAWDQNARDEAVAEGSLKLEEASELATGQEWVDGFFTATERFASDWDAEGRADAEALEIYEELVAHIVAITYPDGDERLLEHIAHHYKEQPGPTREDLIDEACFAVQDLRLWWLDYAAKPETRRVAPTPGRNDPCPCGSGKKYKKCHGAGTS